LCHIWGIVACLPFFGVANFTVVSLVIVQDILDIKPDFIDNFLILFVIGRKLQNFVKFASVNFRNEFCVSKTLKISTVCPNRRNVDCKLFPTFFGNFTRKCNYLFKNYLAKVTYLNSSTDYPLKVSLKKKNKAGLPYER